jgi:hypothetical protein
MNERSQDQTSNFIGPDQRCEGDRPEEKEKALPRWDGQGGFFWGEELPGPKRRDGMRRNRPERSEWPSVWIDVAIGKTSHAHSMEQQPGG